MSSEIYSYLYEVILEKGALDVYTENIYMKKNRPAIKLSILCEEEKLQEFIDLLLIETSTFGVRYNKFYRQKLDRKFKIIDTPYGKVKVKIGYYKDKIIKVTPEYEDCKLISNEKQIPLYKVFSEINYTIKEKIGLKLLT